MKYARVAQCGKSTGLNNRGSEVQLLPRALVRVTQRQSGRRSNSPAVAGSSPAPYIRQSMLDMYQTVGSGEMWFNSHCLN